MYNTVVHILPHMAVICVHVHVQHVMHRGCLNSIDELLSENLSPPSLEPVVPGLFPPLPVVEEGLDSDSEDGYQKTRNVEVNRVRTVSSLFLTVCDDL